VLQPHARLATPGLAGGEAAPVAARGRVVPWHQPRFVFCRLFEGSDDICPLSFFGDQANTRTWSPGKGIPANNNYNGNKALAT
jgi:hypothetical protein